MESDARYLGDGVYVLNTSFGICLTTGHHDPEQADNVIHLEPEIILSLKDWLIKNKHLNE